MKFVFKFNFYRLQLDFPLFGHSPIQQPDTFKPILTSTSMVGSLSKLNVYIDTSEKLI